MLFIDSSRLNDFNLHPGGGLEIEELLSEDEEWVRIEKVEKQKGRSGDVLTIFWVSLDKQLSFLISLRITKYETSPLVLRH